MSVFFRKTLFIVIFLLSNVAYAGYSIDVVGHGVKAMSNAQASAVTETTDPSSAFYNPATLINIEEKEFAAAWMYTEPDINYSYKKVSNSAGINLLEGSENVINHPANELLQLNLHYAARITEYLIFTFSAAKPYNISLRRPNNSIARYHNIISKIDLYNYSSSFAYQINDALSVSIGLDFLRSSFELTHAYNSLGSNNVLDDGYVRVQGFNFAKGYNIGFLYLVPYKSIRIGLHYRSSFDLDLEGKKHTLGCNKIYNSLCTADDAKVCSIDDFNTSFKLPGKYSLGIYVPLHDRLSLSSSVSYYTWSRHKGIDFKKKTTLVQQHMSEYKDLYMLSVGADVKLTNFLAVNLGHAIESDPAHVATKNIMPELAGGRSYAIGATLHINDRLSFQLGYLYADISSDKETKHSYPAYESEKTSCDISNATVAIGTYAAKAHAIGIQFNYAFDE